MRIRLGLTGTVASTANGFTKLAALSEHHEPASHRSVITGFEQVEAAESCGIHWPAEYPPSPHSLSTLQVSRHGNWTVCRWVGESGGKNNAVQTISHQVEYITRQLVS